MIAVFFRTMAGRFQLSRPSNILTKIYGAFVIPNWDWKQDPRFHSVECLKHSSNLDEKERRNKITANLRNYMEGGSGCREAT